MILLAALVALAAGAAKQQTPGAPEIRVLTIDGVINPLSARYGERELTDASNAGAAAVVLRLNTPGGLESSMREMVAAILGARLPVIAYVAPSGARAASAGMFLVLAADIAAMAPGTNIGAAHPVTIGAAQQPDTTLAEKAVSDAAALARAIAERRGRNADWPELAVRRSASITAREAFDMNVVDVIAADVPDLLRQVNGSRVETRDGATVVRIAGARVVARGMSLPERIVHAITDPNIAYLLLTIGLIGVPSVLNVVDHEGASRGIAITTLRAVVGSMLLDDVLAKREEINERLREKLEEVTNRWGIKVTAVEIREIKPPPEIEEAMTRQMSAERDRRAMVTEAKGRREATIRVAQGERRAAILRAEGAAQALERIFEAAHKVDSKTMALQYLEMLRTVGAAESTKLVVPVELTNLLRPFLEHNAAAAEAK